MGEGCEEGGVGDGEEACGDGLPAEFVEVEGEGAGAGEALDAGAVAGAEGEEAAVGGVDVEVGAVVVAQIGDGFERVDEAGVGGAGGGGDEDGLRAAARASARWVGSRMPAGVGREVVGGRPRSQAARGTEWWALAPWRTVRPGPWRSRARSRASWLASVPPVVTRASGVGVS